MSKFLKNLLGKSKSSSEIFYKKTEIKKFPESKLDPASWPQAWKNIEYKGYQRMKSIKIFPDRALKIRLSDALINRKSNREFNNKKLYFKTISTLLYYSAGINSEKSSNLKYRFYPSAGARYPIEIYLLSINSELPNGLYHYYIKNNLLEELLTFEKLNLNLFFDQDWIKNSGIIIILTGVYKRTTQKYGDRGYRYVLIEAGHLSQNLYLIASALNLSSCAIGGFVDDTLNELLDISNKKEHVIYCLALGRFK